MTEAKLEKNSLKLGIKPSALHIMSKLFLFGLWEFGI